MTDDVLQVRLGNFVQELGYVSYVDYGPRLGLILGLVFGFVLLVIVIVVLVIFYVYRRRHTAQKPRRPIVMMSNRGGRTDRVHNSYQDRSLPQATELRPLQPLPPAVVSTRDEEPVKGTECLCCR